MAPFQLFGADMSFTSESVLNSVNLRPGLGLALVVSFSLAHGLDYQFCHFRHYFVAYILLCHFTFYFLPLSVFLLFLLLNCVVACILFSSCVLCSCACSPVFLIWSPQFSFISPQFFYFFFSRLPFDFPLKPTFCQPVFMHLGPFFCF